VTQINKYTYGETDISSFVVDTTNDNFLWIGFALNDDVCKLKKVSAMKPDQIYFDISLSVTAINKIISDGTIIYCALDDDSIICRKFSKTNPITLTTDFSIPSGINEAPVDALVSGSYIYFLTPGNISGENAKIVKFTTGGSYVETIDLSTVTNAKAFAESDVGEFWVITYKLPSEYIRVYQISGGSWTYTINT